MKMFVKVLSWFMVILLCFSAADGLCSYPCSRINRGTFIDGTNTWVFSCTNTSILTLNGVEQRECYTRLGAFLVVRRGSEYRCLKHPVFDRTTRIVFVYSTPFKVFHTNPSICDVCTGTYNLALYAASNADLLRGQKATPPPLGCNLPPNCPHVVPSDIPCTGCEPDEDDGLGCSRCKTCAQPRN